MRIGLGLEPELLPELRRVFPRLDSAYWQKASLATSNYNSISYAAGVIDIPWWPYPHADPDVYWPEGISREVNVDAFASAFETVGFRRCECNMPPYCSLNAPHVCLYAQELSVTHAARWDGQFWLSKLGWSIDIVYQEVWQLESTEYGEPALLMVRP